MTLSRRELRELEQDVTMADTMAGAESLFPDMSLFGVNSNAESGPSSSSTGPGPSQLSAGPGTSMLSAGPGPSTLVMSIGTLSEVSSISEDPTSERISLSPGLTRSFPMLTLTDGSIPEMDEIAERLAGGMGGIEIGGAGPAPEDDESDAGPSGKGKGVARPGKGKNMDFE